MAVLVEHDTEAGVIYIRLAEGDVARTVEIDEMLMVDEDATGNPIGIEFLTALPPPHLEFAADACDSPTPTRVAPTR